MQVHKRAAVRAFALSSLLVVADANELPQCTRFGRFAATEPLPCVTSPYIENDMANVIDAKAQLVEQENEMIDHRMIWLLTLQGLFFLGMVTGRKEDVPPTEVVAGIGIATTVSLSMAITFGLEAIKCIVDSTPQHLHEYIIGLPNNGIPANLHVLLPWELMPILFVVLWWWLCEQPYFSTTRD